MFRECVNAAIGHAYELAEIQRETLGKLVSSVWIRWANEQPDAKPSWLVEWDGLEERDKEVDRMIGEQLFLATLLSVASYFGSPAFD